MSSTTPVTGRPAGAHDGRVKGRVHRLGKLAKETSGSVLFRTRVRAKLSHLAQLR